MYYFLKINTVHELYKGQVSFLTHQFDNSTKGIVKDLPPYQPVQDLAQYTYTIPISRSPLQANKKRVLALIGKYLRAGVSINGKIEANAPWLFKNGGES